MGRKEGNGEQKKGGKRKVERRVVGKRGWREAEGYREDGVTEGNVNEVREEERD